MPLPAPLQDDAWTDVLTGERVPGHAEIRAADLPLPVAVLYREVPRAH